MNTPKYQAPATWATRNVEVPQTRHTRECGRRAVVRAYVSASPSRKRRGVSTSLREQWASSQDTEEGTPRPHVLCRAGFFCGFRSLRLSAHAMLFTILTSTRWATLLAGLASSHHKTRDAHVTPYAYPVWLDFSHSEEKGGPCRSRWRNNPIKIRMMTQRTLSVPYTGQRKGANNNFGRTTSCILQHT